MLGTAINCPNVPIEPTQPAERKYDDRTKPNGLGQEASDVGETSIEPSQQAYEETTEEKTKIFGRGKNKNEEKLRIQQKRERGQ